jgi:multiple sugar transport system substrate-binding protein
MTNRLDSSVTRRRVLAGAGSGGAALALAACGAAGNAGESQPAAAKKPVTIRVTARLAQEADMWPVRGPALTAQYPHIKVEPDLHEGDIQAKIATLIASDSIGDVVHTHFSAAQPQRLYLQKAMRELDSFIAKDKLDLKQWYPQSIDAGKIDGKVVALPFKGKMATVALFYNQSLFEQAGLKVPDLNTSLNDLADMATKLTKPDGSQWGMVGFMPDVARNITGVIRRHNGELFNKDQSKATLDTAEARASMGWYYDALHRRKFLTVTDDQKLFRDGKAAMMIHRDYNEKTTIHPPRKPRASSTPPP